MTFELHDSLKSKDLVIQLPLCSVLLENNSYYPWLFLVPRRSAVSRIMDLLPEDQLQLLKELDIAQHVLWELFNPTQINVAAIGNKTPQLHIHVIGRSSNDPAWPSTVWDHSAKLAYTGTEKFEIISKIANGFSVLFHRVGAEATVSS